MIKRSPADIATGCPRATMPPQNRAVICAKCRRNCGICYLREQTRETHMVAEADEKVDCCACNESWDMCVDCAIAGKYCAGHKRCFPRTPHRLEICFRFIER